MKKTKSVHYNIKTLHEIVTVNDDIADIYTITEPQPLQKFIALLKNPFFRKENRPIIVQ